MQLKISHRVVMNLKGEETMKEIGGFFELELNRKGEYYPNATAKVNSGRNAINYILRTSDTQKVYLPYFTCGTVIEPIITLNLKFEFYSIDKNLEIVGMSPEKLKPNEKMLYINYFGIKNDYVNTLAQLYAEQLIIDNTQAFFKCPIENTHLCYSPRKFFGVPDGGYVFTHDKLQESLKREESYERCEALLGRVEKAGSEMYTSYVQHNKEMCNRPLKEMSQLTQGLLESIDYEQVKVRRERNFLYLHHALDKYNKLQIQIDQVIGPMVYPLWIEQEGLRNFLIQHKIYVPTYWNEVLEYVDGEKSIESEFVRYLLPIPIDQRYELSDMERIVNVVQEYLTTYQET